MQFITKRNPIVKFDGVVNNEVEIRDNVLTICDHKNKFYAKYGEPDPTSKQYAIDINAMSNPAVPVSYTITSDYKPTGLGHHPGWKRVWFKYTPAIDCNISLINTNKDLNWQVIKADDNSLVAENDPENAQVSLTANTQYYIAIAIWNGELGSFTTGFNIKGV